MSGYVQNPRVFLQAHSYFPVMLTLSYKNKYSSMFTSILDSSLFPLPASAQSNSCFQIMSRGEIHFTTNEKTEESLKLI